ncbi:hypothetical protein [Selenihalanaerobacter shriftii]|uniref:hypothetical protein n=1 Tax=Selenihalanaerobacter shriftii TaxID=142842 RepID=UPI001F299562|nr:hypothetical protein [Selenihalanaerobacter shriftii]
MRCWESKIKRIYDGEIKDNKLFCKNCGNKIGIIKEDDIRGNYVDMDRDQFTYSGKKIRK